MRTNTRQIVRQREAFRCVYCGIREVDVGAELTIDHFQPRSQGGSDDISNLVYCCHACNEFKSDYWQPGSTERVLNPLAEDIATHLYEDENSILQHLTDTGAFHIRHLQLNRTRLIAYRREQRRIELNESAIQRTGQPYTLLAHRMERIETEIAALRALIESRLP